MLLKAKNIINIIKPCSKSIYNFKNKKNDFDRISMNNVMLALLFSHQKKY